MAVLAAALVLAWVTIILLGLGYAHLVAQIRELQARGVAQHSKMFPELAAPSAASRTLALTLTTTCATCSIAFQEWLALAPQLASAGYRTVVISVDNTDVWSAQGGGNVMLASSLSAPLLLAYQPALVMFDHTGALLSAEPLGSAAALRDACTPLLGHASSPAS